jgi:hypothetical protein
VTHARQVFITDWNWKTALLSAVFRLAVWPASKAAGARLVAPGALRGLLIQFHFRFAIGGFWRSLLQAIALRSPRGWRSLDDRALARLRPQVRVPGSAGWRRDTYWNVPFVSFVFTAPSLLVNWVLMRKGILITGRGASSLATDLRRIFGGLIERGPCQSDPIGNTDSSFGAPPAIKFRWER